MWRLLTPLLILLLTASSGPSVPDVNDAGRVLATLDDWRAIVFILTFLLVVILTIGGGLLWKQGRALDVALASVKDTTEAMRESAKAYYAVAKGFDQQALLLARVEPMLMMSDARAARIDAVLARVDLLIDRSR